jgi:hypothetical protein
MNENKPFFLIKFKYYIKFLNKEKLKILHKKKMKYKIFSKVKIYRFKMKS